MTTIDKVLVYGAGGVQGGAVARKLLREGHIVHTIVRSEDKAKQLNEQGITAFAGDLADADSLARAHEGVDKVFLLLPVDYNLERARLYFQNAIDAAKNAGVQLLVINNSLYVPDQATEVTAIEIKRELNDYVKQSGIPYIIVQPTLYLENLFIPGVLDSQTLAYSVPADTAIAWISIDDAAEYAVYALHHPELAGQTLSIVGPEALTGNQLAEQFSTALEQEVQFFSLPIEAFEAAISPLLGKQTAAGLAGLYTWITANAASLPQPEQVDSRLRAAVPGTTVAAWISKARQQGFFGASTEENVNPA
ncbi:NAD-dependent epimerase/dehydratase family protein [Paenibacillaceae bacterium]|nr:NAD-dependent epimerase/dehydratase family protein [Paenibacillaceae bacterium]